MDYYLCSGFRHTYKKLVEQVGSLKDKKVGLILNAADVYPDKSWVQPTIDIWNSLSADVVFIDLLTLSPEELGALLDSVDVLFVNGGNVSYLMNLIHSQGFFEYFMHFFDSDKLYVGSSAGSLLVGPHFDHVQFLDSHYPAPPLGSLRGFGLLDALIVPHWTREKYVTAMSNGFDVLYTDFGYPLLALSDDHIVVMRCDGLVSFL